MTLRACGLGPESMLRLDAVALVERADAERKAAGAQDDLVTVGVAHDAPDAVVGVGGLHGSIELREDLLACFEAGDVSQTVPAARCRAST